MVEVNNANKHGKYEKMVEHKDSPMAHCTQLITYIHYDTHIYR